MHMNAGNSLQARANFLASQESPSTWYFARHSCLLPQFTQRSNPLPTQDGFAETVTNADFDRPVEEICTISRRVILLDAPGDRSIPADDSVMNYFNTHFFERLKIRLAERYH
jgi:hypothetical protein